MKLFFSVQLGHLKLSGYGLLSTQGVQNRSQNCWIVSQSEVMLQYMRDPGAPAELGPKGVKWAHLTREGSFNAGRGVPTPTLLLPRHLNDKYAGKYATAAASRCTYVRTYIGLCTIDSIHMDSKTV